MSLKTLVFSIFLVLGVVATSIVLFQSYSFQASAEDSQIQSLSNVLRITNDEVIDQTIDFMADVAEATQKDKGFKAVANELLNNSGAPEAKEKIVTYLNQQYFQKMVTANIIKLRKIRFYDLDFNFISESSEGSQSFKRQLPEELLEIARPRQKTERMKVIHKMWQSPEGAMLSILAPAGGLRIIGYIEVIVDPVHNMRKLQKMTGLPISITQADGTQSFISDNWEKMNNSTSLIITHDIVDKNQQPIMQIHAIQDLSEMYNRFTQNETMVLIIFSFTFGLSLLISVVLMKNWVFMPLSKLGDNLQQLAQGDMQISVDTSSKISEIKLISCAMQKVAVNLNSKLLEIIKYGSQVNEAAKDLDLQAKRAVSNARQQQDEVNSLNEATSKLSICGKQVEDIAVQTARHGEDTNSKAIFGQRIVSQAESSIDLLAEDVNSATVSIAELQENIKNVDNILSTIENIAEQTNLLALNAAIESARAGENGRGFAVVADEVRSLANRTQSATQEVLQVLNQLTKGAEKASTSMKAGHEKMHDSVEKAKEAKQALEEINEVVSTILDMNQKVVESANDQSEISLHTKNSIESIDKTSQLVAEDAANLTNRSEALAGIASKLDELVSSFKTTANQHF